MCEMRRLWRVGIARHAMFFPACQVRVVRFYKSCPFPSSSPSPSPSPPRRPPLCRHLGLHLRHLYVAMGSAGSQLEAAMAMGSAGPQPGAPDCNGQRRTSTGELTSGVGSAGPHPGAPERSGQRRTSPGEPPRGMGSAGPHRPEKKCQTICPKKCQKICQTERLKICQKECQKECQKIYQTRMSDKDVRRYVRRGRQKIC